MNLQESFKLLNIEDYAERISKSNSNGELLYLHQYCALAELIENDSWWLKNFRLWFEANIASTKYNLEYQESFFQNVLEIFLSNTNLPTR